MTLRRGRLLRRIPRAALAAAAAFLLAGPAVRPLPPLQAEASTPRSAIILLSMRIRPYEALAGSLSESLAGFRTRVVALEEEGGGIQALSREKPQVIVTVGQEALRQALPVRNSTPLVYTMVLSPGEILDGGLPGVEGVAMVPSPRHQLEVLSRGFHFRKVALFYNPAVSGALATLFREAAPTGLECRLEAMTSEADLLLRLQSGLSGYDAVLLLPDPSLLTEQGLRALVSASFERKVPLVGFSPLYLRMGAALSLSVPEGEVARRAATLARAGDDADADDVSGLHYPRSCEIRVNPKAAAKLGLTLDRNALRPYGGVREEAP